MGHRRRGWAFGWGPHGDTDSIAAMRHAVERGVNWIDTAAVYGLGHSEEVVGRLMRELPPADRPFVFTKCGLVWDQRNRMAGTKRVLRPESFRAECEASLRRLGVVALVCLGIFMTTLDASIVNIGLPAISRAFQAPLDGRVEWIVIGYLVVIAGLLLPLGRLSDMIGRKPIWTAGLVVFTAGSAACGAAPSLWGLIAARALQGVGGALIFSTSTALLSGAVPPTQRGRALGWGAVAIALGASAGPTIGGILTEHATWRAIFYVNVPIGIVAILATWRLLPRSAASGAHGFDVWGAFLLAIAVAALNLGLSFGQEWGWTSARVLGTLAIGAASLVAAGVVERRSVHPVVDPGLFRNRVFVSAVVSLLCSMLALFAVGFLLPFYLEELRGFSTERAGVLLTPFPLAIMIVAPVAGALADRFGSRWLAPLALLVTATALLCLARLDAGSTTWAMVWPLALAGVGLGLFQAPNTRALMDAAPALQQGMASGLFATTRVTGQALSVAVAGAVFTSFGGAAAGRALAMQNPHVAAAGGAGLLGLEATFLRGFHAALVTCAAFAALGALVALARGREPPTAGVTARPRVTGESHGETRP